MKAVLKVMDPRTGHSQTIYDTEIDEQVAPVRDKVNELLGGGFHAFVVAPGTTRRAHEIFEFDPKAKEIIVTHQLVGG